jgi:hypothetical protein
MNNSDSHENEFYLQVAYSLGCCQMLEQELKNYIGTVFSIIKEQIGETIPFRYDKKDVENHALGRLIETYKKLSNDIPTIRRLEAFKESRDMLAHKSISSVRDYEDELFYPKSENLLKSLKEIQLEASMLRSCIYHQHNEIYCKNVFKDET